MEPIRVLHVVGYLNAGGLETMIMNWYRKIDRTRVQFDFLTNTTKPGFYDNEVLAMQGRIYRMSFMDDKDIRKYIRDVRTFFQEHKEYKVVHGHHSALGAVYLREAQRAGIPVRISHSHIAACNRKAKDYFRYMITRGYGKYANVHFACSMAAGRYMFGKNSQFTMINNGIDTVRFAYSEEARKRIREELGLGDTPVIVHVGRFFEQKNHDFLMEIFQEVHRRNKHAQLLLVGVGPRKEHIENRVREQGLSGNVHFLGARSDVADILCAADVFLLPSLYEGLPLTLVEAQASGLPVVCSATITEETRMTDAYQAISLAEPVDCWAAAVFFAMEQRKDRENACRTVREKGYDSTDVAQQMQAFYLKQYAEH